VLSRTLHLQAISTLPFGSSQKPKTGLWRVRVVRLKTGALTDRATTTVTVQKRR